ncbi:TauD/TfdA dioxygenase family protein [Siccirubricoccus deserti]
MPNDVAQPKVVDSALRITPMHPVIGARAEGVDLRRPLRATEIAAITAAMDRYAVLVFPGQHFQDDEQLDFGRQFGEVEEVPTLVDQARRRLADNRVNDISNLGADGKILAADDRRRMFNLGNLLWHSDSSFKPTPAHYSMLHARVIPPAGGETVADMRAAWDALPEAMQARVRDLVAEHSLIFSRALLGFDELPQRSAPAAPRCRSAWCGGTRLPDGSRSISRRISAASAAGRRRKRWR